MLILVNLVEVNNRREINCLECQEKLVGRRDQKFCCDYCRNTYNNRQNEDANAVVRKINSILRKNRRILSKLNPNGKKTVHLIHLVELGFNFHYHINSYSTKNGHQYFFCYDMGYRAIENQEFLLVHKQEYVS
tara:strand:- start:4192 stop:4590 length:399 start_codon:yes stop_codon:yes gene_type:complete